LRFTSTAQANIQKLNDVFKDSLKLTRDFLSFSQADLDEPEEVY